MTDKYTPGFCNDCGKRANSDNSPMLVRGVSYLAGGEYYNGPEICDQCMVKRRENAIAELQLAQEQQK